MYLKRITIAGFKSFSARTAIDFEPGIMAIVGPNGSGKSNLADAVRWALGEQNKSRLRLNDREEIVFAGTDTKARASFAEVKLLFDNQDGSFGLDITEVEISRRLYRSGESEYRLAGRIARLSDIQGYLAEAGFGAGSYAVIGQGTIDNFIMSSPAERKLLFDEAAGIRGAEIKREASLRKLNAVETNLVRLRDINTELAPRLSMLAKNMAAADEQRKLEDELIKKRQEYIDTFAAELANEGVLAQKRSDELKLDLDRVSHERSEVEKSQATRLQEASEAESTSSHVQELVNSLEFKHTELLASRVDINGRISQLEHQGSQSEALKSRRAEFADQIKDLRKKLNQTHKQLERNNSADERAGESLRKAAAKVNQVQAELLAIRQESSDGTQAQYVRHALEILRTIAQQLAEDEADVESVRLLIHKAGRLLSHADRKGEAEILQRIRTAQEELELAMHKRETAIEHQANFTISRRSLELDEAHQTEAINQLEPVLEELDTRMREYTLQNKQLSKLQSESESILTKLTDLEQEIIEAKSQLQTRSIDELKVITEEATRLERLRSQESNLKIDIDRAQERIQQWQSNLDRMLSQARDWKIEPNPEYTSRKSIDALSQSLVELEAKVAARKQLHEDTSVEYNEVSERQSELVDQIQDLEVGRENLLKLVVELDELIRARFKDNFSKLATQFSKYFVQLFGGGSANLVLTEGDDGTYGVEIKASPKGKRLSNLTALSGGERALAGVALLAAILNVNPSPFVVLDEIDAALDEANSGRLADILSELQKHSQLIVVTHNRQTMQSAKSLFGVTMNDQHASHVISMRLEDASALAAR